MGCFDDFFYRIENNALREIAAHWNEARGCRRMPTWRDIDALKIPRHLPIVWSLRYDRETERFSVRLAGEDIRSLHPDGRRGLQLEEFLKQEDFQLIYARCRKQVLETCLSRDHGVVFHFPERSCLGERIVMPLAEDGENASEVFGATYYDHSQLADLTGARFSFENLEYWPL